MDLFNLQKIHYIHDPEANFIFLMFVSRQAEPAKCSLPIVKTINSKNELCDLCYIL